MELFTITRYDEQKLQPGNDNENKILEKLLKKAKEKKEILENSIKKDTSAFTGEEEPKIDETIKEQEHTEKEFNEEESNVPQQAKGKVESRKTILPDSEYFKILGEDKFKKREKVKTVLPPWLAYPTIIMNKIAKSEGSSDGIDSLKYLSAQLKKNLKMMNVKSLFPVQKEVIPWVLEAHKKPFPFRPRDICVSAPTGSGKTLAFAIPIVQMLQERIEKKIYALVVLPVNELASQVHKVFKRLTENTNLSVILLSRACPFPVEQKLLVDYHKNKYYSKVDIIVTTPGRLVEHLHATKGFSLKELKFLVIDEADRVMEQIQHNWLYHLDMHVKNTSDMLISGKSVPLCILDLKNNCYHQPHKMLFSATLSQDPEKLQNLRLFQPKLFTSILVDFEKLAEKFGNENDTAKQKEIRGEFIGKFTTPVELTEKYCITENRIRPLTVWSLIEKNKWEKFFCFTNSVDGAHRLTLVLQQLGKNQITELSRNLSPKDRKKVLTKFALGEIKGLICSDALARGMDIPEVDVVISYEMPRHIKTYIHRIGRTARAGRPGTAITILTSKELITFNKLLNDVGKGELEEIKIDSSTEEKYAKEYSRALRNLQTVVQEEKKIAQLRKNAKKANKPPSDLTVTEKLQLAVSKYLEGSIVPTKRKLRAVREDESSNNLEVSTNNGTEKKKKSKRGE